MTVSDFRWPRSQAEIERIHRERKRIAVERASQSPFWQRRLPRLDLDRVHEPDLWRRIPVLTKEALREIPPERFHDEFCIAPRTVLMMPAVNGKLVPSAYSPGA